MVDAVYAFEADQLTIPDFVCLLDFWAGNKKAIVSRELPGTVEPGTSYRVNLSIALNTNMLVTRFSVNESFPAGWEVSNISGGGYRLYAPDRIEWDLYDGGKGLNERVVGYDLKVPVNASGGYFFRGNAPSGNGSGPVMGASTVSTD
jgi:hypothetical protein